MPGVNAVAPRVQGGLLDTVLKGVQVARDVYGIKNDMAKNDAMEQATAQNKQNFEDEQAGNFTPKEVVGLGKNYNFVDEKTPNALRIGRRSGNGPDDVEDAYILPKKEGSPLVSTVNDALVNGKHGTATYDLNTGGLMNFVETQKPAKDVTPKYSQTALDNGNIGAFDATTGKVADTGVKAGAKPGANSGADAKADKVTQTRFDNLTNYLAGGRSSPQDIKQESNKLRTAAHGLSLMNGGNLDELNKMTPVEMNELSGVLAAQVAQGSPAQATLQHMTPETAPKALAEAFQYITGKPADANQGEFAQLFGKMLDRQVQTSQNILADKFNVGVANALDLMDKDPDKFNRIMKASGITLDESGNVASYEPSFLSKARSGKKLSPEEKGGSGIAVAGTQPVAAPPHAQDAAAIKWANDKRLSKNPDEAAMAQGILRANGL